MVSPCSEDRILNSYNPFDSGSESEDERTPSVKNTAESKFSTPILRKDDARGNSSLILDERCRHYDNDFLDSWGIENQSVQELENYSVYKCEKTSEKINGCLKIAEEIKEDAGKILVTLHQQGEQINRTHLNVVHLDQDLTKGEKLLSSLGGFFSKGWKPKRATPIKGPMLSLNEFASKSLGIFSSPRQQPSASVNTVCGPNSTIERIEVEKAKQDDKLSDLSNLLSQLKDMAVDMGSEIERQSGALCDLHDDVDSVNHRMKGANVRARRLLR